MAIFFKNLKLYLPKFWNSVLIFLYLLPFTEETIVQIVNELFNICFIYIAPSPM